VIGASAGGRAQLVTILSSLPQDFALPIIVVQHLHATDRGIYAQQLDAALPLPVHAAEDKQTLEPGHVYVAPANYHLLVERSGSLALTVDAPVNWCRPSIDVLFASVATALGKRATGIILTGMGSDGAKGLMMMRAAGAHTLGEAESSCTVYGMPKAAKRLGAVAEEHNIAALAERLLGRPAGSRAAPGATR